MRPFGRCGAVFGPFRRAARLRDGTPLGLVTLLRADGNVIRFGDTAQGQPGTLSRLVTRCRAQGAVRNGMPFQEGPPSGTKRNGVPDRLEKCDETQIRSRTRTNLSARKRGADLRRHPKSVHAFIVRPTSQGLDPARVAHALLDGKLDDGGDKATLLLSSVDKLDAVGHARDFDQQVLATIDDNGARPILSRRVGLRAGP